MRPTDEQLAEWDKWAAKDPGWQPVVDAVIQQRIRADNAVHAAAEARLNYAMFDQPEALRQLEDAKYAVGRLWRSRRKWQDRAGQMGPVRAALNDQVAATKVAGDAADRFRDVLEEALSLEENPGDDELVRLLREKHGKTGPEPRRWRDFITGAVAHMENKGARWLPDVALDQSSEGVSGE